MRVKLTFIDISMGDVQLLCWLARNNKISNIKDDVQIEEVDK